MKKNLDDVKVGLHLTRRVKFNLVNASHKYTRAVMSVIYKSGKVKKPKQLERPSRLSLIKGMASNYQIKLLLILSEIHSYQLRTSDHQNLKVKLEKLISDALRVTCKIDESVYKVKPLLRNEVLMLRKKTANLNENFTIVTSLEFSAANEFLSCAQRSISTVDDFIVHFDTICDFIWSLKDISSRPADRALKKKFLDSVIKYKREFRTDKFPPYLVLLKILELPNKALSPRTYGLWKKQIRARTFHHFVQPQKRFQQ
jgi:hypothetical protein